MKLALLLALALAPTTARAEPPAPPGPGLVAGIIAQLGEVPYGERGGELEAGVEAAVGYRVAPRVAAIVYGGGTTSLGSDVTAISAGADLELWLTDRVTEALRVGVRRLTVGTTAGGPEMLTGVEVGLAPGVPLIRRQRLRIDLRITASWTFIRDAKDQAVYRAGLAGWMF